MHRDCFTCDLKQMNKISNFLSLDQEVEDLLITRTNDYLRNCDMNKTNPEIMGEIWKIVSEVLENDNPYTSIKKYYNQLIISMLPSIEMYIDNSLYTALKVAIRANLIDFSAKDIIDNLEIKNSLLNSKDLPLAIDDSKDLFYSLKTANSLLYLGDNCGEIVVDKLLIKMLQLQYPQLDIYYGVRGKPIVNDVTRDDAMNVKMDEVAKVISNGDVALGTVLNNTSKQFNKLFNEVDVVIAKGQGNFEGLYDCNKANLYFLFMVKCDVVAKMANAKVNDIVCLKQSDLK